MSIVLSLLIGYAIGGIPTGILISRAVAGVDPRTLGSGSSGATNVSRTVGKKWAIVVLILDALKGFLPVFFLAPILVQQDQILSARIVLTFGTVLGHIWTPYANFRGGKGVATAAGAMIALDSLVLFVAFAMWLLVFLIFCRVSLASLLAAISIPSAMLIFGNRPDELIVAGIALTALLIFTHRENIRRLLAGREHPIT